MMYFIATILIITIGAWFIYKNQEIKSAEKRYQKHQETAKLLREINEHKHHKEDK